MSNPDFGKTGNSVWNQPYMDHLNETFFPNIDISTLADESNIMLDRYQGWIESSKLNNFTGLDAFPYRFATLKNLHANRLPVLVFVCPAPTFP